MSDHHFFAMLSRMKYINRWSLMRGNRNENLSEHTLETAVIVHALIALHNKRFGGQLDAGKAIQYAMYHDCSEILTGDLPTPVKYFNLDMRAAYQEVEQTANQKLLSLLPEDLQEEYAPFFCANTPEQKLYQPFVKAADKLSALIKCTEETRMGNGEFQSAYTATLAAIQKLQLPAADAFLKEFIPAYALTLDELNKT